MEPNNSILSGSGIAELGGNLSKQKLLEISGPCGPPTFVMNPPQLVDIITFTCEACPLSLCIIGLAKSANI